MNRSIIPLFFLLAAGCATTPRGQQDLLAFLHEGTTLKEEVLLKLGQPAAGFQDEAILTYRLARDQGGYFLIDPGKDSEAPGWPGTCPSHESLVLVFDDKGILRKHSLVELIRESP